MSTRCDCHSRRGWGWTLLILSAVTCAWGAASEVETDILTVLQGGNFYGPVSIHHGGSLVTNELQVYYPFSQAGSPTDDASGNGNTGDVVGATWTNEGWQGGAYSFDGNDYISLGDKFDLSGSVTALTVCAWIKPSTTNAERMIINKLLTSGPYTGWALFLFGNNKVGADLMWSITNRALSESVATVGTDRWYFVAACFRADPNRLRSEVYVDGVLEGTNQYVGSYNSLNTAGDLWLGYRAPAGQMPYRGLMDDAKIFQRWMPPAEIAMLYQSGSTNAGLHVAGPTVLMHLIRQGDVDMGAYTNGP